MRLHIVCSMLKHKQLWMEWAPKLGWYPQVSQEIGGVSPPSHCFGVGLPAWLLLWTPGDHLWLPGLGELWTSAIASSLPASSPTPDFGLLFLIVGLRGLHEQGHHRTRPNQVEPRVATEDAEYVRRKGRWLSTRVLEIDLQEAYK